MVGSRDTPTYGLVPKVESDWKWDRTGQLMDEEGFDHLLVTDPNNVYWLTGIQPPATWDRRNCVIVPRRGVPIAVVREHNVDSVRLSTHLEDVRGYADSLFEKTGGPVPKVIDILEKLEITSDRVGIETDPPYRLGISCADLERLKNRYRDAEFTSCSRLLYRLRRKKSTREIDEIRTACEIITDVHESIPELLEKGMNQRDAADAIIAAIHDRGGYSPFVFIRDGTDGIGPSGTYRGFKETNADRPIQAGYLLVDMGCNYNDYWSDFSRHYWVGDPPQDALECARGSVAAVDKAIEMTEPGASIPEIIEAVYDELSEFDISQFETQAEDWGWIGHEIGLEMVDGPFLTSDTSLPLEEGMTIAYEPTFKAKYGQWIPEVNVVVTDGGCELLSSHPSALTPIS